MATQGSPPRSQMTLKGERSKAARTRPPHRLQVSCRPCMKSRRSASDLSVTGGGAGRGWSTKSLPVPPRSLPVHPRSLPVYPGSLPVSSFTPGAGGASVTCRLR